MIKFFALREQIRNLQEQVAWLLKENFFWKSRALALEKRLEAEIRGNRIREQHLTDRIVVSKGQTGIREKADRQITGAPDPVSETAKEVAAKLEEDEKTFEAERKHLHVEHCLANNFSLEEAEADWEANKRAYLAD